jgi:hypothetical protein
MGKENLTMLKKIGITALLAALSGVASANGSCKPEQFWGLTVDACTPGHHHISSAVKAPEIDPASAAAALTLVLGGLAVIRSRRKNSAA